SGNPTFDAATVHWGSTWRIPTKEEMEELIINCSRTWITSYNGVNGYRMTGPNGNSIFLPAAGRQYEDRYIGETNGYYWSATSWNGKFRANHINFYPDNEFPIYSSYRNYGQPIRPVSN
ncbi:MAG: serine/threonine protein kinase, partial [Bacteroidales bacterium]|nr:serine/threonine protein kinase [Bacteroidales bacterium]